MNSKIKRLVAAGAPALAIGIGAVAVAAWANGPTSPAAGVAVTVASSDPGSFTAALAAQADGEDTQAVTVTVTDGGAPLAGATVALESACFTDQDPAVTAVPTKTQTNQGPGLDRTSGIYTLLTDSAGQVELTATSDRPVVCAVAVTGPGEVTGDYNGNQGVLRFQPVAVDDDFAQEVALGEQAELPADASATALGFLANDHPSYGAAPTAQQLGAGGVELGPVTCLMTGDTSDEGAGQATYNGTAIIFDAPADYCLGKVSIAYRLVVDDMTSDWAAVKVTLAMPGIS
ncbi:MAG: hypothetical protein LBR19_05185 [Bifidobacteriaceae bacterium]|jgi:hypothetical protein|nr:hypothetical protein [Bifidobacteriaceae bacterium]